MKSLKTEPILNSNRSIDDILVEIDQIQNSIELKLESITQNLSYILILIKGQK